MPTVIFRYVFPLSDRPLIEDLFQFGTAVKSVFADRLDRPRHNDRSQLATPPKGGGSDAFDLGRQRKIVFKSAPADKERLQIRFARKSAQIGQITPLREIALVKQRNAFATKQNARSDLCKALRKGQRS